MGNTTSVSNSLTVRVQFKNDSGMLGRLASEVGRLGGDIGAVDLVSVGDGLMVRDLTINCPDDAHAIAGVIPTDELHEDYIIPSVFNKEVVKAVARAVAESAHETGVARREIKG